MQATAALLSPASSARSWLRPLGVATALALVAQIAVTLATGAAQEPLERVLAPAAYQAVLLAHPAALRVVFSIDSVFLVLYTAFFVQLARVLAPAGSPSAGLARLAVVAMCATALLDAIENQHILSQLAAAEHGVTPSAAAIVAQATASQVKFHLSYFAIFLFGLVLPRGRALDRLLAASCLLVQLPLGVAAFVAPPPLEDALVFARWGFYLAGFLLLSRSGPLPATTVQST